MDGLETRKRKIVRKIYRRKKEKVVHGNEQISIQTEIPCRKERKEKTEVTWAPDMNELHEQKAKATTNFLRNRKRQVEVGQSNSDLEQTDVRLKANRFNNLRFDTSCDCFLFMKANFPFSHSFI